jgi:hypothetical protein
MDVLITKNPENHQIVIEITVTGNYGDFEANPDVYSSEAITEFFGTGFKCPQCRKWHLNQNTCGMDSVAITDIQDKETIKRQIAKDKAAINKILKRPL